VVARLCLPVSSVFNEALNEGYFAERIEDANKRLALGSSELDKLAEFDLPEMDGFIGTIQNSAAFLKKKSMQYNNALVSTVKNAGDIVSALLELMFLYGGVFVIQVLALPLLSCYCLVKVVRYAFGVHVPYMAGVQGGGSEVQNTKERA